MSSQAGRRLEALYSERGGVPVLFTSPYYVQLMDEVSYMIKVFVRRNGLRNQSAVMTFNIIFKERKFALKYPCLGRTLLAFFFFFPCIYFRF